MPPHTGGGSGGGAGTGVHSRAPVPRAPGGDQGYLLTPGGLGDRQRRDPQEGPRAGSLWGSHTVLREGSGVREGRLRPGPALKVTCE